MKVHITFDDDATDEEILARIQKVARELADGNESEQPPDDVSSKST